MINSITQVFTHAYGMWRYRWYALLLAAVVCIVGWAVVFSLADKFESSARVSIDTTSVLKPLLKGLATDNDALNQVTLITRILLSRPNLQKVARATDMDLRVDSPEEMESLLRRLHNNIKITQPFSNKYSRNSSSILYFDIAFVDRNAETAQKVVQTLVDTLIEDTLGKSRTDTGDAQKFLINQITEYEQQLILAEQRLAAFKKENVGLMPGEGGGYYARLQAASEAMEKIQREYELAERKRDVLKKQLEGEIPVLGENTKITSINEKVGELQIELDALLLKFTEKHPSIQNLRSNITQLEQRKIYELKKKTTLNDVSSGNDTNTLEINPVYQNVKIALRETEVEIAALWAESTNSKKRVEDLKKLVDTVPEVEAKLVSLDRNYDVIKDQYLLMLARLESAKLSEDVRVSNFDIKFQIIEPPIIPFSPVGPNRLLFDTAVLGVGLLAGVGLAFLLNTIFSAFITTKSLGAIAGFPVLGRISMASTSAEVKRRKLDHALFATAMVFLLIIYGGAIIFQNDGVQLVQRLALIN